jgi:hypothetical protein
MPATPIVKVFIDGQRFGGSQQEFLGKVTDATGDKFGIYGFSSSSEMRNFAKSNGWSSSFDVGVAQRKRARAQQLTRADEKRIRELQTQAVKSATARFRIALRAYKVKSTDIRAITRLVASKDPFVGSIISSTVLYAWPGFTGAPLVLGSGLWYRRLSWWNYNDRADSAQDFHHGAQLYRHIEFLGTAFWILPGVPLPYFGWFANRASSAICNP